MVAYGPGIDLADGVTPPLKPHLAQQRFAHAFADGCYFQIEGV